MPKFKIEFYLFRNYVLIVRRDDGPIGLKHVALYVLSMVIIDMLDENINTFYKIWNVSGQIKLS